MKVIKVINYRIDKIKDNDYLFYKEDSEKIKFYANREPDYSESRSEIKSFDSRLNLLTDLLDLVHCEMSSDSTLWVDYTELETNLQYNFGKIKENQSEYTSASRKEIFKCLLQFLNIIK